MKKYYYQIEVFYLVKNNIYAIIKNVLKKGVDLLMSKSIFEYKKDYRDYQNFSAIIFGMAAGCGLSQNYFASVSYIVIGIIYKKMSDFAYKNSANSFEYQLLNRIYGDVREELVKNIKTLEMSDIEGIFAYYCFILRNNYLSFNRNLPKYQVEGIFNEEAIISALVLNNHGVCRNIAPSLTDLYGDFNIESKNILCDYFEVAKEIVIDANKYMTEEDFKNLEGKENFEDAILELNDILKRISNELLETEIISEDKKSRHCINLVSDDEHSYLFDAATFQYYIDKDDEGKYRSNRGNYIKVLDSKKFKNKYKNTMTPKFAIPHPIKDADEIANELNKRQKHLKDNIDVIEQMHKDIEPLLVSAEEAYKLILQAK